MSASVPRRLVLTGLFGAGVASILGQLPGRHPTTADVATGARSAVPRLAGPPPPPPTTSPPAPEAVYDLVLAGGRVLDPDSGFDDEVDVGVAGGAIAHLGPGPLRARRTIDATGRVVAPGFIDLLSYDPNPYGVAFKVADGVTSNLGMHGLNAEAGPWFERYRADPPPVHFGGAFDHAWARRRLEIPTGRAASAAEVRRLRDMAEAGLADGWAGVHMELEYTPGASAEEVRAMGEAAAGAGVPVYVHGRYSDASPPGTNADTLAEVLGLARDLGVGVHVEHLTSTGGTFTMAESLATLAGARAEGLDVSACMYPYDFWATYLGSARFGPGWQERFRISFDDLVVAGTGERLTEASFARERRRNTLVAALAIPEADVRAGLASDLVMIGSDAILEPGDQNHPRAAGCFARVLGRYARDERALGLPLAVAKMTILPARRLEGALPAFARKGRVQVGADADLTVFDPATVGDRATLDDPSQPSVGIDWVLVGGEVVKTPEGVRPDARPGSALARA